MKYLKKYKLYESYINPISDYITDFIDAYNFEVDTPEMGVCDMILKSSDYDSQEILSMYQTLLKRLEDDDYELKEGNYTYISFYKNMVHIRIERIVKDLSKEFKFETKEQEIAYNAVLKVISPEKLILDEIRGGSMNFSKIDAKDEDSYYQWICITKHGQIILPILRGRKSQRETELPFNDSDINWFKKLIELDRNDYRSKEYSWIGESSQEELREKYK